MTETTDTDTRTTETIEETTTTSQTGNRVTDGHTDPEGSEKTESTTLTDADREKLTEVVRKERAAAKAARAAAEKAEGQLAELQAAELRRTIAEEKGLTPEQAAFLTGESAEEMGASADALLAAFGGREEQWWKGPREATLRTGATGTREPADDMSNIADRVLD